MSTFAEKKELNNCNCPTPHGTDSVRGSHHNSTTSVPKSQCLQELSIEEQHEKELKEKFTEKKEKSEILILSYDRLSENSQLDDSERDSFQRRSVNVANCGTFLEFAKYPDKYRLHRANFCRDRLCPMCSWRRSLKIFGHVSQCMDILDDDYSYIFLTLTVPNPEAEDLVRVLNDMSKAWTRFTHYKRISKICKGFFKVLEVNYSKNCDNYHPHFHVIIAVPKSYFTGRDYISHDEWLSLWQKAMKDPSITQVFVRKIVPRDTSIAEDCSISLKKAVAEVAKYSVKDDDYLLKYNSLKTDFRVYTFAEALMNRRLCAFGGCFKDAHTKLGLDDPEDGDLIHVDCDIRPDVALQIVRYKWSCGAYQMFEVIDKANILAECDEVLL